MTWHGAYGAQLVSLRFFCGAYFHPGQGLMGRIAGDLGLIALWAETPPLPGRLQIVGGRSQKMMGVG